MALTTFDRDGRRRPPTRDLPGWVWAVMLFMALVSSAWAGAHGGLPALLALTVQAVAVIVVAWLCLVLVAIAALFVVAALFAALVVAEETFRP